MCMFALLFRHEALIHSSRSIWFHLQNYPIHKAPIVNRLHKRILVKSNSFLYLEIHSIVQPVWYMEGLFLVMFHPNRCWYGFDLTVESSNNLCILRWFTKLILVISSVSLNLSYITPYIAVYPPLNFFICFCNMLMNAMSWIWYRLEAVYLIQESKVYSFSLSIASNKKGYHV